MEKIVVLMHGFGEDHQIFNAQIRVLQEHYTVYAPDLPGSGERNHFTWETGTESIEWLADWLKGQLDTQGIGSCILLGHSMGGYITLAFAEKYPERLLAFGLIHSTAFADQEAKKETRAKAIDFIKAHGAHAFLKTAIPGLFGPAFAAQNPEAIDRQVEDARHFETPSLVAYYRAMMTRPDRTHVLKSALVPVLLVAGTEDMAAPIGDLLQQAPMPPVCHFFQLQNVGHMGMMEDPDNLNRILLNFLSNV
jgi:pimeloyl-ACP methyl ester carboxylesterase